MSTNTQAVWDAEDLRRFRCKVVGLAAEAGGLLSQEEQAREAWREKRKARRVASAELGEWVDTPRPELADAAFAGEARRLTDQVVDLEQEERSSLSAWKVVSARRRRAQLELQTTVRAWTAPVPLFDAPKEEPTVIDRNLWPEKPKEEAPPRSCRVCGCTDLDCSDCMERTGIPCHWVEADLCSACVPEPVVEKPYAWAMTLRLKDYTEELVTYAAKNETAAWRKAMKRKNALEVLRSEPLTEAQYRKTNARRARL